MLVDVLVVVVLVDLEAQRRDLGQHAVGESRVDEQSDAAARRRGQQQLRQLVAHALGRDAVDLGCELRHRRARAVFDLEPELGREAGGAQHPQRVVAERLLGRRGSAQQVFATRSSTPPDGSTSSSCGRRSASAFTVKSRRVRSSSRLRAEHDLGLARVAVVGVGAVGRDLDGLARDLRADRAERAADVPVRLGDRLHDREDLVGRGIRREVEVVDRPAEEGVAHRAADEGELVPGRLERRGQPRHGRRSRQLAQPVEGRRDTLHAPYVKWSVAADSRARSRLWTSSGCRGPRRRIACMVAESNLLRAPRRRLRRPTTLLPMPRPRASGAGGAAGARHRGRSDRRRDRCADRCARRLRRTGHGRGRDRRGQPPAGSAAVSAPADDRRRRRRARRADDRHDGLLRGARGDLGRDRERDRRGPRGGHRAPHSCRGSAIDASAELDEWLGTGAGAEAASRRRACCCSRASPARSAPGATTVVSFTVPGEGVRATADDGPSSASAPRSSSTACSSRGTSAFANADAPASDSVAVALAAPLTVPASRGRASHGRPARGTGPRRPGSSTRQLDALAGRARRDRHRPAHHRLDPRARHERAGVRTRVAAAPRRPAERGLPARLRRRRCGRAGAARAARRCSTPTSFSDVLDPANFAAATPTRRATPADATTAPATPTRADRARADARRGADAPRSSSTGRTRAPTSPGPPTTRSRRATSPTSTPPASPPRSSLPATSSRSTARLGVVDDRRLDRARRRRRDSPGRSDAASRRRPTPSGARRPVELLAELALDAGASPHDRCSPRSIAGRTSQTRPGRRRSSTRSAGSGWSSLAGLSEAIGAPPESRTLVDEPEDRRASHRGRAHGRDGGRRHRVRDGARRPAAAHRARRAASCSSLLDVAWLDDPVAWNLAVSDWLPQAARRTLERLGRAEQHDQRGRRPRPACPRRSRTTCPTP